MIAFWCPAWHVTASVTPRCCLSWFSFLALSDFQGVGRTWVVELAHDTTPILPQTKLGLTRRASIALRITRGLPSKDMMVRRWWAVTPVGAAREQVPFLYGGNRTALARHKFWTLFYYWPSKKPNEETWSPPQELPGVAVVPRMHKTQKTTVGKGTERNLLLTICFDN